MSIPPKGLVTIAFLKTRLDEGHDHLTLFEPIVFDALHRLDLKDFLAADLRPIIIERTGLTVPNAVVQTLLARCVRKKILERKAGRFFRTSINIPESSLDQFRGEIRRDQEKLAESLVAFGHPNGIAFNSQDGALIELANFISANKVGLMLNGPAHSGDDIPTQSIKLRRTIARFITEQCLEDPQLKHSLAALTEGIILSDLLLLRDIPESEQRFQNLQVFLDTGILFDALDLTGPANALAAKEGLALLRQAGARTVAFSRTLDEMRRILAVYESHLGTTKGILSLHQTPLTHHVVGKRMSPADIRIISAGLERSLANIGIGIKECPEHHREFTLNEAALAKHLVSAKNPETDTARIKHDVDSVAAVLTLRGGRISYAVERSIAIFSSPTGKVIRNVKEWYAEEKQVGIPPIMFHTALTTIAWLKRPMSAPDIKLHELAAICLATIQPSKAAWAKMTATLRRLCNEGQITDDEAVAVIASDLTEVLLARLDDDMDPDATSIEETINRVMQEYRQEAEQLARDTIETIQAEGEKIREAAEEAVRKATAEAALAKQNAEISANSRARLEAYTLERIASISQICGNAVYWLAAIIFLGSLFLAIPGIPDSIESKTIARIAIGVGAVLTFASMYWGTSLLQIRDSLVSKISEWLNEKWFPN